MTTTRPHTNRDDVSDLERLREEYEIRHDIEVADAIIAALGDEIAELTGQNIDLEVWRASAVKRAEQAEAELAAMTKERDNLHIMELAGTPAESRQDVDHINGDALDNRLENLRVVTRKVNLANGYLAREKALREELAEVKRDRDRWEWVATHEPDNQTGLARAELAIRSGNYVEWLLARYQPEEER